MSKSRAFNNQFCPCGQPATTRNSNTRSCDRCAHLTNTDERRETCGVPYRDPGHCGWVELRMHCNDFLHRAGLSTNFQ